MDWLLCGFVHMKHMEHVSIDLGALVAHWKLGILYWGLLLPVHVLESPCSMHRHLHASVS